MPDCCVPERVFEEGGATWAAAVATWAQILMCRVGLVGVAELQSCEAHRLQWCLHLDELSGKVVGLMPGTQASLLVGSMVVATRGALMGLPVGLSVGTLRTGDCSCMEHVICLLSSIWGLGMLGGAYTLRTCSILRVLSGVMVSSKLFRFACKWACVASTIHCRSCTAWKFLALPIIPWMALMQSASAIITLTLSACVMEGLVIHLCWNWNVSDSCSLLVCLIWQLDTAATNSQIKNDSCMWWNRKNRIFISWIICLQNFPNQKWIMYVIRIFVSWIICFRYCIIMKNIFCKG